MAWKPSIGNFHFISNKMNNSLVCEQAIPGRSDGGARKRFPSPLSHSLTLGSPWRAFSQADKSPVQLLLILLDLKNGVGCSLYIYFKIQKVLSENELLKVDTLQPRSLKSVPLVKFKQNQIFSCRVKLLW